MVVDNSGGVTDSHIENLTQTWEKAEQGVLSISEIQPPNK